MSNTLNQNIDVWSEDKVKDFAVQFKNSQTENVQGFMDMYKQPKGEQIVQVTVIDNGIGKEYYLPDGTKLCLYSSYVILWEQMQEFFGGQFNKEKIPSQPTEQTTDSKGEIEWEIVSLYQEGFPELPLHKEGEKWVCNVYGYHPSSEKWLLEHYKIHSVKRLSDNTVFSVGDDCSLGVSPITGFKIDGERIKVLTNGMGNWQYLSAITYPSTNGSPHTNPNTYPITKNDDKVTREELLEAESKAFYAARETNRYGFFSEIVNKYPTFSDYKNV